MSAKVGPPPAIAGRSTADAGDPRPAAGTVTTRTLADIDRDYTPLGCLGRGGFGSVFLAERRSGRRVALKFMPMDTDDEDQFNTFRREIDAVVKLNTDSSGRDGNRDLAIVHFEEWFVGDGFACIVMNYADGGTLSREIELRGRKSPPEFEPYSERRIAWYALQLCDALAYAHGRGVAHHDVKSANVLIDASAGGRLLLADFGTSIAPGEESVGFTKSYAPPELLASHELEDYADLRADKIDSFGLGCVLFELLMCSKLEDLSDGQTLAEYIADGPGLDAAMDLGRMRLPWVPPPPPAGGGSDRVVVGYTRALRSLAMNLLRPNPEERWLPSQMLDPLRSDPLSPLLAPYVSAARAPRPGAPVTVDNVQLGMLVQRGPDWDDGDADGGVGSVGVVVKLDADASYTCAAFPSRSSGSAVESICCRIGAGNKYELAVGPVPISDYCYGSAERRWDGVVYTHRTSDYAPGHLVNPNCMIVGADAGRGLVLAAPMERKYVPAMPVPRPGARRSTPSFVRPGEPAAPPLSSWRPELGLLAEVSDADERSDVLALFHDVGSGGLGEERYVVESIRRVQDARLWESYARRREVAALENWGIANEIRAFQGAPLGTLSGTTDFSSVGTGLSKKASVVHYDCNGEQAVAPGRLQMILSCVTLGRVLDFDKDPLHFKKEKYSAAPSAVKYHSEIAEPGIKSLDPTLVYPQYVIAYRDGRAPPIARRRIVQAVRPPRRSDGAAAPGATTARYRSAMAAARGKLMGAPAVESGGVRGSAGAGPAPSPTKQCVLCLERPVRHIFVPCGHPCLCDQCNVSSLSKLRGKCPECRQTFKQTAVIYGRVVNDDI